MLLYSQEILIIKLPPSEDCKRSARFKVLIVNTQRFMTTLRIICHIIFTCNFKGRASQVAKWVKNPPAMQEMQETWVRFLGQEDLLGEEMATHSSILAWRIPRTEEPGLLQSVGSQKSQPQLSDWTDTLSKATWLFLYCGVTSRQSSVLSGSCQLPYSKEHYDVFFSPPMIIMLDDVRTPRRFGVIN